VSGGSSPRVQVDGRCFGCRQFGVVAGLTSCSDGGVLEGCNYVFGILQVL